MDGRYHKKNTKKHKKKQNKKIRGTKGREKAKRRMNMERQITKERK
jgi:hypothetical protein